MKKYMYVAGVVLLLLSVVAQAAIIKRVEIVQAVGATAFNSAGSGTLTWTMGTSGSIMLDDWTFIPFNNAVVSATFSGVNDLSSGGVAKATFSTGSWSVDLAQGGRTAHLSGTLVGPYSEEEVVPSDVPALDGRAVVHLDHAEFSGFTGLTLQWGNENMLGSISTSVIFPSSFDIQNYASNYLSKNSSITVYSDETAVPEPATMLLLGLGAVLLRKKK